MNALSASVLTQPDSAIQLNVNEAFDESKASILIIDDEPAICSFASFILKANNYHVETCTSATEALAVISENPSRFDLAILDLSMPVMNGETLMRKLYELGLKLKLILSSGLRSKLPAEELYRLGVVTLMPKPYSVDELSRSVKSVLGR